GGPGLAVRAAKVLTCAESGPQLVERGLVLVRDGKIEAVGGADVEVPAGYEQVDVGASWLMPGMVDLHSHIGGTFDINDTVLQANPGLRVHVAVVPSNPQLELALAAGVTTVLFIPGSGTTVGGEGVLLKTGFERYEDMLVRNPGSLKIAQADNPKAWGYRMQRGMLNWTIREVLRRGAAYAERWRAFEAGAGERPHVDPQFEVFRHLVAGEAQVSAHTQVLQVVLASIDIVKVELGLPLFIDHGTFDSYLIADVAERAGVPAILGPRIVNSQNLGRGIDVDGRFDGVAARFQQSGHTAIGFNTDAPVVPAEELPLQAAMGVRYGFDDRQLDTVRGLTIVPARTAGIAGRVGSLEPGKDADLVVVTGHPADPRSWVERVWIEGRLEYAVPRDGRRW
ncbi:MAG TPA: amidohydrolase family protein, partial [Planctomycetota bacterium]|nr:amidohydrolase family protein [Planctomycetota bacterium]